MRKLILLIIVLIAGGIEFVRSLPWAVGYFNRRYL